MKNDHKIAIISIVSILIVNIHFFSIIKLYSSGFYLVIISIVSIIGLLLFFLIPIFFRTRRERLLKIQYDNQRVLLNIGSSGQFEGEDGMEQVLNLLGSVASIASLIMQGLVIVEEEGKRRRLIPANPEVAELPEFILVHEEPSATNAAITLSETVIDQEVLDAFHDRLKKLREEFADRISRAKAAQGLDAIQAKATREICDVLNRIRALNGGKLPGDLFEKMWKSYKCIKSY